MTWYRWWYGWLGDPWQLPEWTPERAAEAERTTLRGLGVVVEPVYLWSRPAQERERAARERRLQRAGKPSGRVWREATRSKVAAWGRKA